MPAACPIGQSSGVSHGSPGTAHQPRRPAAGQVAAVPPDDLLSSGAQVRVLRHAPGNTRSPAILAGPVWALARPASAAVPLRARCSVLAGRLLDLAHLHPGHLAGPYQRGVPGVTRPCAWCDGPIPAKAPRDAVRCSVRCRQARHRFRRTADLPLGRKTLAGYQEQGPSLSSHPALMRSTEARRASDCGVIANMEDQSPWMPGASPRREVAVPLRLHAVERRKGQRR